MTPGLALNYEGGNGNGVLGIGWGFSTAYIQRQTFKGTPRYIDAANGRDDDGDGALDESDEIDFIINEMREELVPVPDGANTDYFCENEGTFIRYRRVEDHWQGTLPDGTLLIFGQSPSARIADSDDPTRIFRWFLEQQIDTYGNTIRYTYQSFPGPDNLNQTYYKTIEYGAGAPPWTHFHGVAFTYEDRPDVVEDGRPGFLVRTGKRLTQIDVFT